MQCISLFTLAIRGLTVGATGSNTTGGKDCGAGASVAQDAAIMAKRARVFIRDFLRLRRVLAERIYLLCKEDCRRRSLKKYILRIGHHRCKTILLGTQKD